MDPNFFQDMFSKIFDEMGARPEKIEVDVLIRKGDSLEGMIIVPGNSRVYFTEEQARAELKPGQTIYKVDVYRLE